MKDRDGLVRGAIISLCLFDFFFVAVAVAICCVSASSFRAILRCSGPCGLPGPLRVTSLIPVCSAFSGFLFAKKIVPRCTSRLSCGYFRCNKAQSSKHLIKGVA